MASQNKGYSKRIYVIGVIAVIIIGGWLIWTKFKYQFVHSKIDDTISEKSGGLYRLRYDSLYIDEVNGSLSIKNLDLIGDRTQYAKMVSARTNPSILLSIHVPQLNITNIQTPKALLNKEIVGGKIEIDHASIQIELSEFLKDTSDYNPVKEIYKQILGKLSSIKIDSIQIRHSTLIVKDIGSDKIRFSGIDFSILLTDLLIDSVQKDDSSRILFSRNLELSCQNLSIHSKDKNYLLLCEGIHFNSKNNQFSTEKINIIPRLSEPAFAKASKIQKDRYDFRLEGIHLYQINREALWRKRIEADTMTIENGSLKIFRDLSYPHDSINRVGTYPQQQIRKLPIPVNLKKLVCRKCYIEYKEKNAKSDSSGKVQFVNASATIRT